MSNWYLRRGEILSCHLNMKLTLRVLTDSLRGYLTKYDASSADVSDPTYTSKLQTPF